MILLYEFYCKYTGSNVRSIDSLVTFYILVKKIYIVCK